MLSYCDWQQIFSIILHWLNEYWSNCKLHHKRWKNIPNCIIYIYIIVWYNRNSNTKFGSQIQVNENGGWVKTLPVRCGLVFELSKTNGNWCGSDLIWIWHDCWQLQWPFRLNKMSTWNWIWYRNLETQAENGYSHYSEIGPNRKKYQER
jgi:hypothetical protein